MRFGALLNDAHVVGMPPTSVAGADCADGTWRPSTGFCGPGSVRFPGPLALIAPCGGSSGLPNEPAFAADTVIAAPMADAANKSRLENMVISPRKLKGRCRGDHAGHGPFHRNLVRSYLANFRKP